MMRKLTIGIECADKTCAVEPGKFCKYLGSRRFGTVFVCSLFPGEPLLLAYPKVYTDLHDLDGWVQRCPACLAAEKLRGNNP